MAMLSPTMSRSPSQQGVTSNQRRKVMMVERSRSLLLNQQPVSVPFVHRVIDPALSTSVGNNLGSVETKTPESEMVSPDATVVAAVVTVTPSDLQMQLARTMDGNIPPDQSLLSHRRIAGGEEILTAPRNDLVIYFDNISRLDDDDDDVNKYHHRHGRGGHCVNSQCRWYLLLSVIALIVVLLCLFGGMVLTFDGCLQRMYLHEQEDRTVYRGGPICTKQRHLISKLQCVINSENVSIAPKRTDILACPTLNNEGGGYDRTGLSCYTIDKEGIFTLTFPTLGNVPIWCSTVVMSVQ
jgi:hypothetical protein